MYMLDCFQVTNRNNKKFRTEIFNSSSLLIDVAFFSRVDAFELPEVAFGRNWTPETIQTIINSRERSILKDFCATSP